MSIAYCCFNRLIYIKDSTTCMHANLILENTTFEDSWVMAIAASRDQLNVGKEWNWLTCDQGSKEGEEDERW